MILLGQLMRLTLQKLKLLIPAIPNEGLPQLSIFTIGNRHQLIVEALQDMWGKIGVKSSWHLKNEYLP